MRNKYNIPENESVILQAQDQAALFLLGEENASKKRNRKYNDLNDAHINKSKCEELKKNKNPIIFSFTK